jgi:hypothetical protein
MFLVTEADAAAIRAVYEQEGELSAAIELRRRFLGITDNAKAREHVRMIAGWKPLPMPAKGSGCVLAVLSSRPVFRQRQPHAQEERPHQFLTFGVSFQLL